MRERLLRSTLAVALLASITLGVPLLLLARHQVYAAAHDLLQQQAASIAAGLEDRLDAGRPVDLTRYVATAPHRRIIVRSGGRTTVGGPKMNGGTDQAQVRIGGSTVTIQASTAPTTRRAREVTAVILGFTGLALSAAVVLGRWQARRLAQPLSALAARAGDLGRGTLTSEPLASGISEIDEISAVLDRSAQQLSTTFELQRNFASDAAHQLRTPLTGIGLRLDELTRIGNPAAREEADAALRQVERLDRTITTLLARAHGDASAPARIDLCSVVEQEAALWQDAFIERGRHLHTAVEPQLSAWARPDHVTAVLHCLLDNALHHGSGAVSVACSSSTGHVTVSVQDGGPGVPQPLRGRLFLRHLSGSDGTGIGLALAASLTAAEGGQLTLDPVHPNRFLFTLPTAPAHRARENDRPE